MKKIMIIAALAVLVGCGSSGDNDTIPQEVVLTETQYGTLIYQCTPAYYTDNRCYKECFVNTNNYESSIDYDDVYDEGVYTHPGALMYEGDELQFTVKEGTYSLVTQVVWTGCDWQQGDYYQTTDTYYETFVIEPNNTTTLIY